MSRREIDRDLVLREAELERARREEMAVDLYRERRNPHYQEALQIYAGKGKAPSNGHQPRGRSDSERRRLTFGRNAH